MPDLTLSPVAVPSRADDGDGADFRELIALRNAHYRRVRGNDEYTMTPEQALPHWQDRSDRLMEGLLARVDGEVVASGTVTFPQEDGAVTGEMNIRVTPDRWGEGIGSQLVTVLERLVAERGRTSAQGWSEHPESDGDRLAAATGYGSLPRDHVTRFLVRHGFVLEQVYRNSRLLIGGDLCDIRDLTADARSAAGAYRTISWEAPTPEEHLDGFAWMKSRMSTDAPAGGVDVPEQAWDAERVRRLDAKRVEGGYRVFVTAAQHRASGQLAAFTELVVDADRPLSANQDDTLVLKAHRGHRLGMLLKGENLLRMREAIPEVAAIDTYNAEENRPMLSINEAMGFVPVMYAGEWQKRLS
ncbi:GNAT family N-acetyltransferase [Microbacterium deminutum]|uniref:GNAT family N-acetyltransferase n=1 Tax=Microbacterium deminutum TaxID=344164 RepID=A0ABN2R855_9MICO